jgi:hypothetical protein
MLITIRDWKFLTDFYFHDCHRGVRGGWNQAAIAAKLIEVGWLPEYGDTLEIAICQTPGNATIELGWSPDQGAWPIYIRSAADGDLRTCDRHALTRRVGRFLLKHDLIHANGTPVMRGVA